MAAAVQKRDRYTAQVPSEPQVDERFEDMFY